MKKKNGEIHRWQAIRPSRKTNWLESKIGCCSQCNLPGGWQKWQEINIRHANRLPGEYFLLIFVILFWFLIGTKTQKHSKLCFRSQESDINRIHVSDGGIDDTKMTISIYANQTQYLRYDASFYGI